jgi:hypothetical protein
LTAIPLAQSDNRISLNQVPPSRRRRVSMARRFQSGSVSQMGSWYVVRYRVDTGDGRRLTYQRICPASGPGRLSKAQRNRRAEENSESEASTPSRNSNNRTAKPSGSVPPHSSKKPPTANATQSNGRLLRRGGPASKNTSTLRSATSRRPTSTTAR